MKIADKVKIWKNKPFDEETINQIIELEKNQKNVFKYVKQKSIEKTQVRSPYPGLG